eukprot:GHVP01058544.1.p1 GENE.GHVP01058544.1~~GHVP01058544.1.p1  ORF type:complete len:359 (-),score=46.04 GHVP01058544.1:1787-2863(-)
MHSVSRIRTMPISLICPLFLFNSISFIFFQFPRNSVKTEERSLRFCIFRQSFGQLPRCQGQRFSLILNFTLVPPIRPKLRKASVTSGRLDPSFTYFAYSYYVRLPEGTKNSHLDIVPMHDSNSCGNLRRTLSVEEHTIVECVTKENKEIVRYIFTAEEQIGESTRLENLIPIFGVLSPAFDPLEKSQVPVEVGRAFGEENMWIAFYAKSPNPKSVILVKGQISESSLIKLGDTNSGFSLFFRITEGQITNFQISVEVPGNKLPETYDFYVEDKHENDIFRQRIESCVLVLSLLLLFFSSSSAYGFLTCLKALQLLALVPNLSRTKHIVRLFFKPLRMYLLQGMLYHLILRKIKTLMND